MMKVSCDVLLRKCLLRTTNARCMRSDAAISSDYEVRGAEIVIWDK